MCIRDRLENGTHVLFGVALGGYKDAEITLAHETIRHLKPGMPVSYTHLRAHETVLDLVCRLLLEKKKKKKEESEKSVSYTNKIVMTR